MGLAEIVSHAVVSSAIAVSFFALPQPASASARADQEALEAMCTKNPSVVMVLKETLTSKGRDFRPYTALQLNDDRSIPTHLIALGNESQQPQPQLYGENSRPTCLTGLVANTHMLAGAAANVKGGMSYFILSDPLTNKPVFKASANARMTHALSFRDPQAGVDYILAVLEIESVDIQRRAFTYFSVSLFALYNRELILLGYHPLDTPGFRNYGPLRPTGLGYELRPHDPAVLNELRYQDPTVIINTEKWFKGLNNGEPYAGRQTIRIRASDLEGFDGSPIVTSLENTWEQGAATGQHVLSPLGFPAALGLKNPWVIETLDSGQGARHASETGKVLPALK